MIFGGFTFLGALDDVDSGPVVLKSSSSAGSNFIGKAAIDYSKNTVTLAGLMNLPNDVIKIQKTLNCQEKSGRAN